MSSSTVQATGGVTAYTSNVIDVSLILLGAVLLPMYLVVYQYDERIFNMLQCTHIILMSLYAVLYINYIKKECFAANEARYRAFNVVFTYTMFIFFIMFVWYVWRIFRSRR